MDFEDQFICIDKHRQIKRFARFILKSFNLITKLPRQFHFIADFHKLFYKLVIKFTTEIDNLFGKMVLHT